MKEVHMSNRLRQIREAAAAAAPGDLLVIPKEDDEILTTEETAAMLKSPVATVRWWRHKGVGPKSFVLGSRKVRYRRSDVLAWLDEQYNKGAAS
jgi:predicted DNA-binding transcriptional regulator AlpA